MIDGRREAAERVSRFERLGGVDLSRLDPEERDLLLANVRVGLAEIKRGKYRFRCPLCRNVFDADQEMEPICTGPNAALDEHEPTVMENLTLPGHRPPPLPSNVLYERVA